MAVDHDFDPEWAVDPVNPDRPSPDTCALCGQPKGNH